MMTLFAACAALLVTGVQPSDGAASEPPADPPLSTEATPPREKPIGVGERLKDFTLLDHEGKRLSLADSLAKGPVVVVFYRGSWCPYCVKALGSVEESVADINRLGATVLAISPETPEQAVDFRERLGLSYELLVDRENRLASRLGLMFTLDEATVERYRRYGIDVGRSNGSEQWQLPIPATFVLDKDGVVRYAWTNKDYTKRAPATEVLETLRVIAESD